MIRPLILSMLLATTVPAAPALSQQSSQLAASVQHRLNALGFREVDARTLSTRQLAALHLKLQGPVFGGVGLRNRYINLRSEVGVILRWEEEGRKSY